MTPEELYDYLTRSPCEGGSSPRVIDFLANFRGSSNAAVFGTYPQGSSAAYWLARIVDIVSTMKNPCWTMASNSVIYNDENNDYEYKLCLPFKILEKLDGGAYKESCSIPEAAVAHAFRNSVDTMRACHYVADQSYDKPFTRMATEYLTYWAWNSIADTMLLLGPDIIPTAEMDNDPSADTLDVRSPTTGPMSCWPGNQGVPGAAHGCTACVGEDTASCRSCGCCPPEEPDNVCCTQGTPEYYSECCGFNRITYDGNVSYWLPSQDGSMRGDILTGRVGEVLYHIGVMERKEYGGVANLRNNSADRLKTIDKGLFLEWVQERNGWNYETMKPKPPPLPSNPNMKQEEQLQRVRSVLPIMLDVSVASKKGMPTSNSGYEDYLKVVKQLLWNGEGVALFTNVGFPKVRDSQGISYPDRIWYTMYSVIGYDDRRIEFDECVYVLQCPLGDWVSGGNPSWGPLPDGAFLVTETVFKDMIRYMNNADYYPCRDQICPVSEFIDCTDPLEQQQYVGCGPPVFPNCLPYFCTKRQSSFGMLFALSLNDRFTQDNRGDKLLSYNSYIPTAATAKIIEQTKAYCRLPPHLIRIDNDGNVISDATEIEFQWGFEGNMFKDRDYQQRAMSHSLLHQDIETSPLLEVCLDPNNENQKGGTETTINLESYVGYLKVPGGKPPSVQTLTFKGKGCF